MREKWSLRRLAASLLFAASPSAAKDARSNSSSSSQALQVSGLGFALQGNNMSYVFHVDDDSGDLLGDHYGGHVDGGTIEAPIGPVQGWVDMIGRVRRELPDLGRGDFRIPAIQIRQSGGYTISEFKYKSYTILNGKPELPGLPSTFGKASDVATLVIHLFDNVSSIAVDLSYSVFPKYDAIARSVNVTNLGTGNITIEKLASFSVDLPYGDYDMLELKGDWAREGMRRRRKVDFGNQGFASAVGYSSHLHNPFLSLVSRTTTESQGEAYGFSLIYTGSFAAEIEKGSQGVTRAMLGLNPSQFSWPLAPGQSFVTPECVSVYASDGIGSMSRKFHNLYRNHLMKSKFATETRPFLLNSWEGLGFNYDASTILRLAKQTAELGAKLFVLDDGWFGTKYPRVSDDAGLGDWTANPARFPDGLPALVGNITGLSVRNSTQKLKFGIWVESEMVNPKSILYEQHPDWALHAGNYPRTLTRNQLVLNLALPEVQQFIIDSVSNILNGSDISYVKWDNNRGIHETPAPYTDHQYMLGLYRVYTTLTERFPNVLWEGCASGGGRFDPGILRYFPQIWASDDTDAVERVYIQFGTSLAYPPSAMGAHISATPNGQTDRDEPIEFRAHVAMMGGSVGLELDPSHMPEQDKAKIPDLIKLAEKVNPIVVKGDMWRLRLPEESNYPAALFISKCQSQAVLFYFKLTKAHINKEWPVIRLQGLDSQAVYKINGNQTASGATLMNKGISYQFGSGFDSKIVLLEKVVQRA